MNIFIGSSREQIKNARTVARWLEEMKTSAILWNDAEVFRAGHYTWQALCDVVDRVDAAIFIFGADDETWYRGEKGMSVRDNILLEYGLFSGKKGNGKVIFMFVGNPRIATDLAGITGISLEGQYRAQEQLEIWINDVKKSIDQRTKEQSNLGEFRVMDLSTAFHICLQDGQKVDHLRIFAISTYKSVQVLRLMANLSIETASIMLRQYENEDDFFYEEDMVQAINSAIISWKYMVEKGNINTLQLSRFNYHPDEGFYIIDDRYLIVGYLNYDAITRRSEFANEVILIDNATPGGQRWIRDYIKRFEKIEEIYENGHKQ